jgi:hypothetical protein
MNEAIIDTDRANKVFTKALFYNEEEDDKFVFKYDKVAPAILNYGHDIKAIITPIKARV